MIKTKETLVQESAARQWMGYDLTEDDFLSGKQREFSPESWEYVE